VNAPFRFSDCAIFDHYQAAHLTIPYHRPNVFLMPHTPSRRLARLC
jgi:hypothetical protein